MKMIFLLKAQMRNHVAGQFGFVSESKAGPKLPICNFVSYM